ncbi:MAG: DUF6489 family protein [Alphaproteobacteria bacterium]|nr:DUF6489 family protein [Alphaproteobacteria bacterium]
MKITVDIDCTPEEARTFLGLPDVKPMQDQMLDRMQEQIDVTIENMGPEAMMKALFPSGIPAFEDMQRMFWQALGGTEKEEK